MFTPAMFTRAYRYYIGSFGGLSREVWLLAFITFVNRAGSMVVPFLSLYLTKDMGLTKGEVGWIMSSFGADDGKLPKRGQAHRQPGRL